MSIINETTLKNQPPDRRTGTGTSTSIPEKSGSDRGPGRWILSPDEMSMWWVPDGAPKPEEPPVGGQDHA
jgi:hypothetical protein